MNMCRRCYGIRCEESGYQTCDSILCDDVPVHVGSGVNLPFMRHEKKILRTPRCAGDHGGPDIGHVLQQQVQKGGSWCLWMWDREPVCISGRQVAII